MELLKDEDWVSINNTKKQFEPNLQLLPEYLINEKRFKCSEQKFNDVLFKYQQQNSNAGMGAAHHDPRVLPVGHHMMN